jgi:hypothetical protein
MIKLDGLSIDSLNILIRLLADDPVTGWVLQSLDAERKARVRDEHAFPLTLPTLAPGDAKILNRHLIVYAYTLENLAWEPHADNFSDKPFLDGARFLALISEALGQQALAGADKLQ